jgi:hypothetical protein
MPMIATHDGTTILYKDVVRTNVSDEATSSSQWVRTLSPRAWKKDKGLNDRLKAAQPCTAVPSMQRWSA